MKTFLPAALLFLAAGGAALGDSRIEKNLKLEAGGELSLRTDLGSVKVRGTDQPGARIVVTSRDEDLNDLLKFDFQERAGSVTIVARKLHHDRLFEFGRRRVAWEIEVPAKTRVTLDTSGGAIQISALSSPAKLETSGGAIEVRDHVGEVAAHTSGGGIVLSHVKGECRVETSGGGITAEAIEGRVDADTSGGSIRMDGVTGDIKAHTSGGGIKIREAGGRVEAETSGGSVQAAFARGNARGGRLESSGGGVSVSIDPQVGLAIDASGNSVHADVPITIQGEISRRHLRGNLGAGGETLQVRTSGGSVSIRPL
ncbi:MAG TPA: hypothetical protein VE007_00990 [Thermoanaerobaculia bacterium]|nr:hypothetical protein [Thermoanaerobaculia bacterium]